MKAPRLLMVVGVITAASCAHTQPEDLTSQEHRAEAARHQQVAAQEGALFDPTQTREVLAPRTSFSGNGVALQRYNPTAEHLNCVFRRCRSLIPTHADHRFRPR